MTSSAADRALALADQIDLLLDTDPEGALRLATTAPAELAAHPALRLAHALALWEWEGARSARAPLLALCGAHPEFSDAWHALGRLHELEGRHAASVACYTKVLSLDEADDAERGFVLEDSSAHMLQVARQVIEGLPTEFRQRLDKVPVFVEARPALHLVERGFDPRSVGLFEGPDHREPLWDVPDSLPRIVLYAANLLASVDPDDMATLEREIEITVLHEIGHYFGLDEERLHELGLG